LRKHTGRSVLTASKGRAVRAHLAHIAPRRGEAARPTKPGPGRNGRARLGHGAATAGSVPTSVWLALWITARRRSLPGPPAVLGPVPHWPFAKHWGDSGRTPTSTDG